MMMIVISGTITNGSTPFKGWWIIPDNCDCSARASSWSASIDESWNSLASSRSRPVGRLAAIANRAAAIAKLTAPRIAAAEMAFQNWTSAKIGRELQHQQAECRNQRGKRPQPDTDQQMLHADVGDDPVGAPEHPQVFDNIFRVHLSVSST
jgi:hypothetical protein